jgi:hypothetical protein
LISPEVVFDTAFKSKPEKSNRVNFFLLMQAAVSVGGRFFRVGDVRFAVKNSKRMWLLFWQGEPGQPATTSR